MDADPMDEETEAVERVENLRLEDLPEIADPDDNEEEQSEAEPEPTLEEVLQELVANLLHKTSAIAVKAMKELEQHATAGDHIPELLRCAEQLVRGLHIYSNFDENNKIDKCIGLWKNHFSL